MTTSTTNTRMTYAKSRSRLPLSQCLRLATKQLGVGGIALALPILVVLGPVLAYVGGLIEVGTGMQWVLSVGSVIAGIPICVACFHRAAMRLCTERNLSITEAVRSMRPRWRSSILVALLIVLTTSFPVAASHLLSPSAVGFATSVSYFVGGVWFVLWPLIVAALAVESCDAADAISRAVHFVLSRPVAATLGLLAANGGAGIVVVSGWTLNSLVPTQLPLVVAVIQATALYVVSNVLAYLFLREQVDAIEWDEIATEPGAREQIPLSGRAASDRRIVTLSDAA